MSENVPGVSVRMKRKLKLTDILFEIPGMRQGLEPGGDG
jgi:hypothetical protein